jgi:hypothetical protein
MLLTFGFIVGYFLFPDPDTDSMLANGDLEAYQYQNGRPIKTCRLEGNSRAVGEVARLLGACRRRWKLNFTSFAPTLFLQGKDFSVDIAENLIVLNCVHKGCYIQVVSRTCSGDVRRLREALECEWREFVD